MAEVKYNHKVKSPGRIGPVIASATLIGIGMGGFIDGIVFHQLLQWHQMLSAKIPPDTLIHKSVNMFWDGIFHCFTWITTMIGIVMLWNLFNRKDIVRSTPLFTGGLLLGWGLFNVVESIFDHYILVLHNVKENSPDPQWWNHGFLLVSLIILFTGWRLISNKRNQQERPISETYEASYKKDVIE